MFIWTVINTSLVYFKFEQPRTHWMRSFSKHLFCFQQSLMFYTLRWRGFHSSIFRLYTWLRSKYFHFNSRTLGFAYKFLSETIKQNLEQDISRRMHKSFRRFCWFLRVFLYLYVPPLKKNGIRMCWYLCHIWTTDSFSQLTLSRFSFYE